jgi:hypothetical protein
MLAFRNQKWTQAENLEANWFAAFKPGGALPKARADRHKFLGITRSEDGMGLSEGFLADFDHEMVSTRKTLERIPEDKLAWKPHDKSMGLGRLAGHIAELPSMGSRVMQSEIFDLANRPPGI